MQDRGVDASVVELSDHVAPASGSVVQPDIVAQDEHVAGAHVS
jgi:hypothetical protein